MPKPVVELVYTCVRFPITSFTCAGVMLITTFSLSECVPTINMSTVSARVTVILHHVWLLARKCSTYEVLLKLKVLLS